MRRSLGISFAQVSRDRKRASMSDKPIRRCQRRYTPYGVVFSARQRSSASRDYTLRRLAGADFAFVFVFFVGVFGICFCARGGASAWLAMLMPSSSSFSFSD